MVDERFHLRLHLLAIRKHDLGRVRFDRSFRHSIERLPHDIDRLAQFGHPAHVTIKHVAFCAQRHLELEILVTRVGHVPTQVEIHTASAQRRPARAQRNRIFCAELRNALGAHHPDRIPGQQVLVFVDPGREAARKIAHPFEKSDRRLERNASDSEIGGHHALPADHFEYTQDVFALAEAIQENRHRSDVEGVRTQPDQMRIDARQFVQENA